MPRHLGDRALLAAVRRALRPFLPPTAERVPLLLVGVSGGPDSLALLALLRSVRERGTLLLHAVTIDHGLRGRQGAADARWVADRCADWDIPCSPIALDLPAARGGLPGAASGEQAARVLRYRSFARVADAMGAAAVAVGHTRDDQVESVLLHLLRGAGPQGLRGMGSPWAWCDPETGRPLTVVRPLLQVSRADTHAFCARHHLDPRTDATNGDTRLSRNRLRLEVLPVLRAAFPGAEAAVLRLAAINRDDDAYWQSQVDRTLHEVVSDPESMVLDRSALLAQPEALQARLLLRVYRDLAPGAELQWVHVQALMAAAAGGAGRSVALPGGVTAVTTHDRVEFHIAPAGPAVPGRQAPAPIRVPGSTEWRGWIIDAAVALGFRAGSEPAPWEVDLDWSDGGAPLLVRSWSPGDRMQPGGMAGSKKLQDLLVDARVPRHHRQRVPVVTCGAQVLWVAGVRRSSWRLPAASTRAVLRLRVTPAGPEAVAIVADLRRGYL